MPSAEPASVQALAAAALAALAGAPRAADGAWRTAVTGPDAIAVAIECSGPDLPSDVPEEIATPALIARQRPWVGRYRLVVRAPLIVLDLYWTPGEPLRIMSFSRGDWERVLLSPPVTAGP